MVTVPEANRILWAALDGIYAAQRDAVSKARLAIETLASSHPEIVRDPLVRESLMAAITRQDGISRYADSQLALVETMLAYWEQRAAAFGAEAPPVPLVRRSIEPAAALPPGKVSLPVGE